MSDNTFDANSLGKYSSDFCALDYFCENWQEAIHKVHTPSEAIDQILSRLCDLYCFMQPEITSNDFFEQIFKPVADGKDLNAEEVFNPEPSNKSRIHFFNFVWITCFHAAKAQKSIIEDGNEKAWIEVAKATYNLGVLEGLLLTEPAVAHIISSRSKAGATTRNKQYEPLRQRVLKIAAEGKNGKPFPSRRQAVLAIMEVLDDLREELGVEMKSKYPIETIDKWLSDMKFGTDLP